MTRKDYDNFMSTMNKELGISKQEIKNILKASGVGSFKQLPRSELRAILRAHRFMNDNAVSHFVEPPVNLDEALKCPIPECEGERQKEPRRKGRGKGWICSIGGNKHATVFRIAKIVKVTREEEGGETDLDKIMEWLLHESKDKEKTP